MLLKTTESNIYWVVNLRSQSYRHMSSESISQSINLPENINLQNQISHIICWLSSVGGGGEREYIKVCSLGTIAASAVYC